MIFLLNRNQFRGYIHRRPLKRDIRKQLIGNESLVVMVSNRFRSFLGHWSLEDALFPLMYQVAGFLVNRRIKGSGIAPVPLHRMLDRL